MTLELLKKCLRFALANTWPVLAVPALYLPFQFALNLAEQGIMSRFGQEKDVNIFLGSFLAFLLLQTLIDTLYYAAFYAVSWAALHKRPLTYASFRDWFLAAAPLAFVFRLLFNTGINLSLFLLMIPALAMFMATPFMDAAILYEQRPLGSAFRRNLQLLASAPAPALFIAGVRFLLTAWIPYALILADVPDAHYYFIGYLGIMISAPLDLALVVLYARRAVGRYPIYFSDLADYDDADE